MSQQMLRQAISQLGAIPRSDSDEGLRKQLSELQVQEKQNVEDALVMTGASELLEPTPPEQPTEPKEVEKESEDDNQQRDST